MFSGVHLDLVRQLPNCIGRSTVKTRLGTRFSAPLVAAYTVYGFVVRMSICPAMLYARIEYSSTCRDNCQMS